MFLHHFFQTVESKFLIPGEAWGYVDVRKEATMFWWLYGAQTSDPTDRVHKPLVLWFQGGPGASSTGYGNFEEIGPLDVNLKPRNSTWIKEANVLFVDNPVGCGFSYVGDPGALTTNISEITDDLTVFFKAFLEKFPVFKEMPFFIAGESYGGKMAAAFGAALQDLIHDGKVQCELTGVALGDSLISFQDATLSYAPYLFSFSLLDEKDFLRVRKLGKEVVKATDHGDYDKAMDLTDQLIDLIGHVTDNVDVYNVLRHNQPDLSMIHLMLQRYTKLSNSQIFSQYLMRSQSDPLVKLMNGPIRKKLGIIPDNVTWGGQSEMVAETQRNDIPSSVLSDVGKLIRGGVKVVVYQGQLDMICGTLGAESWIAKLDWDGLPQFLNSSRKPLYAPSKLAKKETGAFLKNYKNFELYYILNAGHMVPIDAPEMALEMLRMIVM